MQIFYWIQWMTIENICTLGCIVIFSQKMVTEVLIYGQFENIQTNIIFILCFYS